MGLLWGYNNGGKPTSETPTHLICHMERLKADQFHRLIIHSHPTNVICMTHVCPLDDNFFTEKLWKMQVKAFEDLYKKYQDTETSPATEKVEKIIMRLEQPFTYYYFIVVDGIEVGAIRVVDKKEHGKSKRILCE